MALPRDAVLRARARLARGVVGVRALAGTASVAARSVWSDNVIALLAQDSELGVRRARAVDASSSICVRLLARSTCRTSLMVLAHDIWRRAVLALARDAVLRARAWHTFSLCGREVSARHAR